SAMPAVAGSAPLKSPYNRARFDELWTDPVKVWEQEMVSVSAAEVPRLKLEVCAQLIDFLISENRPEYLNKAARGTKEKPGLLSIMFGVSSVPVEAHILLILDRDQKDVRPEDWKTLQLALETHR